MKMWKLGVTLGIAAVGSVLMTRPAEALPNRVITTYYSNPAKTIWCGTATFDCDASYELDGVTSPYKKQRTELCH